MSRFQEYIAQIWKSKDLRYKILFTLGILIFIRVLSSIPLPQVDRTQLDNFLGQSQNQVFGILGMFTGGSLSKLSIDLMGVGPYITASIIVQLLTKAIPSWEAMHKESNAGREKLNQFSRYLTVPLAIVQGFGTISLLKSQGVFPSLTTEGLISILLITTAASVFVMWLGELISEKGIGNGISLIIALGIVAGLPTQLGNTVSLAEAGNFLNVFIFAAISLLTVWVVVYMNEAERKIPVTYARRTVSGGNSVNSYLPIRVNSAGVIPIIFALSFLTFPTIIARFLSTAKSAAIVNIANTISNLTANAWFYGSAYFLLVFLFTFFYTYIVFQPDQIAENLQKQGGFVPGVRPGSETVQFLKYTISRLTVVGAIFLAAIAVLPNIVESNLNMPALAIGGTSILIVVSVVIETARQLNSQLVMRRYDTI
jgi:preprotein translocase subunit SecY